jgi:hypothetical protein
MVVMIESFSNRMWGWEALNEGQIAESGLVHHVEGEYAENDEGFTR